MSITVSQCILKKSAIIKLRMSYLKCIHV